MPIKYMLDTNIASYLIKGNSPHLENHIRTIPVEQVCISVITQAELRYGLARLPHATHLAQQVEHFLQGITVLDWDVAVADAYGLVRADLEKRGQPIGNMDMQIAAHALVKDLILVTHNTKEFQRVLGLKLEDWMVEEIDCPD